MEGVLPVEQDWEEKINSSFPHHRMARETMHALVKPCGKILVSYPS